MKSKNESWGQFRLQVLGQLLASPPVDRGGLSLEIERLSSLTWTHPIEKEPV